jgi:transcription termination factor Rho
MNYTDEGLRKLSLFELRNIARELGVHSPTLLKKDNLIVDMLAIVNGQKSPYVSNTKKGRPPKPIIGLKSDAYEYYPSESIGLNLMTEKSSKNTYDFCGMLDPVNSEFGFLRADYFYESQSDISISGELIRKYSLRKGDIVKGKALKILQSKFDAMVSVKQINGESASEFSVTRFEELVPVYPDKRISLKTLNKENLVIKIMNAVTPLGFGGRGIFVVNNGESRLKFLKNLANEIERNNKDAELFVMLADSSPETLTDFKRNVKANVVSARFDEAYDTQNKTCLMLAEYGKRLLEKGKDVILFFDNLSYISKDEADTGSHADTVRFLKKLLLNAVNAEGGGSLSVFLTITDETLTKLYEFESLKQVCGTRVFINCIENDCALDIKNSQTDNVSLLLSKDEYEEYKKLKAKDYNEVVKIISAK